MDSRFLVEAKGNLSTVDGQGSPLAGLSGYFRLQPTSPDLIFMVRQPPQGGILETKPRIVMAGDCGSFAVQDLIAFLGQARWTGVVRVLAPSGERSLLLKDGDVRSASSDSAADRIGEVMIRLGYVTRAQLSEILNEAPPARLGRVMVERRLIKAHDLYKCLNEQIGEIFHGMMLSKEGTFMLIDQEIDEKILSHNLSVSMQGLLMDSIRKIDELAQFRKKIPHSNLYVTRKKPSDGKLERDEDQVLGLVDGQRTVLELGQGAKVSEFDATRITYRLLEGGYVQLSQAPLVVPSPSAPSAVQTINLSPSPQPMPAPPPPDAVGATAEAIVEVFNTIFRQIRDEVEKRGAQDTFLASADAAIKGHGVSASPVLEGLTFRSDGTLDPARALVQFEQMRSQGQLGSEPAQTLKQALSDVMFFLLFQAGELLESSADENLARRVKDLLASIDIR